MFKRSFFVLILAGVFSCTMAAQAVTIQMQGVNYPDVSAVADFSYTDQGPTLGQITIDMDNTSTIEAVLTAFAFNGPASITGASMLSAPNSKWVIEFNPNDINTPMQLGFFDIAGETGPNFNGGKPNFGIPEGESGLFIIGLTGLGMDTLNEASFLNLFSELGGPNVDPQYFVSRFQAIGIDGEGSDVAIPDDGQQPVPEPGTILLLGIGLIGVVSWKRRGLA